MEETAVQRLYRAFNVVQKSSGISSIFLSLWSEEDSYQNGLVALAKMQILRSQLRPVESATAFLVKLPGEDTAQ